MTGRVSVTHQDWVDSFTAEKYILGELSGEQRERFEEHYFECPECADAVRLLSQVQSGTRTVLRNEAACEVISWPQRFWSWWLRPQPALAGAMAALALAAVLGYQNAQLRNQLEPQTLQAFLLPPATRGDLPVIHPSGPLLLLEGDVPSASGNLAWTLVSGAGATVLSGAGPAPDAGMTLKVMLPSARLQPGDYSLNVRSDSGSEWIFRFSIGAR